MASYNWTPVVMSLLNHLQKAGVTITAVDNGEDLIEIDNSVSNLKQRKAACEEIVSVDESYVRLGYGPEQKRAHLFIVLGNEPCETVCDYGTADDSGIVDNAIDNFIAAWEGRKCPMVND
ncbi:MAG: hypothetical protein ACK45I_03065 [Bacteroidota bacterium]|jgi:hypothetical protein